jgi:hypothetical protein
MGTRWMNYLNLNENLDKPLQLKFNMRSDFSFDSIYEYPNEDLCLFKNFPHNRYVYPLLMPGRQLECTCTLYWLQFNSYKYKNEIEIVDEYYQDIFADYYKDDIKVENKELKKAFLFCNSSFNLSKCEFEKKFEICQSKEIFDIEIDSHHFSFHSDFDILYLMKCFEFVFLVILAPIFCFFGIILNLLTILVIRNKKMKKDFNESMYKHVIINGVFNIVYCLIVTSRLINTCIFYGPSIFCSNFYQEDWAQYFKLIFYHFLGNTIKICLNVSYLIFSISRLKLITTENTRNQNLVCGNRKLFIYICVLFLTSSILSIFKFFEYKTNDDFDISKELPMEIRDYQHCLVSTNHFQCKLFKILKISNRSLNDLLFVILNVLIDVILLIKFKKLMDIKLHQIEDIVQRKLIEKNKQNVNHMILFNSFIYIISHLPALTMTLLLIIFSDAISIFCNNRSSCDLLNEEAEFFGLISIVCQFFVFKLFDKNFKMSFNEIKLKLFAKMHTVVEESA